MTKSIIQIVGHVAEMLKDHRLACCDWAPLAYEIFVVEAPKYDIAPKRMLSRSGMVLDCLFCDKMLLDLRLKIATIAAIWHV
ncbi:hypothetical protein COLO4_05288 [Corchorus olitorius]|uniref:Uncharacterized protein n=1 Tax=Corchorus olitorius TaxID=93759 RepID=A0A1R3KRH1_9ROSI|nr:hypothetical protein COLO4_05288 [Corchorus olitorius]